MLSLPPPTPAPRVPKRSHMKTKSRPKKTRSFTPLQDEILNMATEKIGPAVAVEIVAKKFARVGVRLTRVEKRKLRDAIVRGTIDQFSLTRRRGSPAVVTFTSDDGEALTTEASRRAADVLHYAAKQSDRHAAGVLKALHQNWPSQQRRERREMVAFRRRLQERWERPFALFRMFMTVYRESGEQLA